MHSLLSRVPRLQSLAVFESAARLGSFTKAAHELGMTQPGVSRSISGLEQSTGLELFVRSPNNVRLSSQGSALLETVTAAFDMIDSRLRSLTRGGDFVLAANPGYAQQWLIPHLDQLQQLLGETSLRLNLFDRDDELAPGSFDGAVHLTAKSKPGKESIELFDEVVVPVASPKFAALHGLGADSEAFELMAVPKLHLDGRNRTWLNWETWFKFHDVRWTPVAARNSYNNYPLVMSDAFEGRGAALAWRGLVEERIEMGHLVPVGPEAINPTNAYQFIADDEADPALTKLVGQWLLDLTQHASPA